MWHFGRCGTCVSGRPGSSPAGWSTRSTWCASRPSGSAPLLDHRRMTPKKCRGFTRNHSIDYEKISRNMNVTKSVQSLPFRDAAVVALRSCHLSTSTCTADSLWTPSSQPRLKTSIDLRSCFIICPVPMGIPRKS